MREAQVKLVEPQTFTINFPSVGAPMAIGAESDQVVIFMRLRLRPGDNVMDVHVDISASGDGTSVSRLNQDAPSDLSRYWRASILK